MRIVMLSDAETQGGAAIATSRLATALCDADHHVVRLISGPDGRSHAWTTMPIPGCTLRNRVARKLLPVTVRDRVVRLEEERVLSQHLHQLRPDVINIHNIHSAGWQPNIVALCAQHAPVVWTLHDAWSFTGRCAYMYDCQKFVDGCDALCPTAREYPALAPEKIAPAWMARKAVFDRYPKLTAVTPSRWLADTAREGLWHDHRIEVIPNGVPLGTYRVLRREVAREALGVSVSLGRPVLLIAAHDLGERRKGGALLVRALESLQHPILLIVLGRGHIAIDNPHVAVQHLGYVDDELVKMLAYNAADLLLHPAPVDNLPNVVMEAVACGTPVVGFPIGGMPDMVRPKKTGWLATEVSSPGLARVLNEALADVARGTAYRDMCRAVAEGEYDSSIQVKRYMQLFRSLMSSHKNTAPTSTENQGRGTGHDG